ncbi:hypothetical protein BJP36_37385 [Moorena producens JHB]|uniref:Uncharacterized protein n=2 Tax=Moorena producens TaxID=1155739 RepID=A0A9Q9UWD8_MOOP1|nr:hypothetical protein [Moorena producens]NEQ16626.1 hypothetical protein [Moorena sp. SIO3E2]WAN69769.1 hypothetical protein BJP36_37385 [Moorena producens JHB]
MVTLRDRISRISMKKRMKVSSCIQTSLPKALPTAIVAYHPVARSLSVEELINRNFHHE